SSAVGVPLVTPARTQRHTHVPAAPRQLGRAASCASGAPSAQVIPLVSLRDRPDPGFRSAVMAAALITRTSGAAEVGGRGRRGPALTGRTASAEQPACR